MPPPTVFISYSHKDTAWKDRLLVHLRIPEKEGLLELWDDARIAAGAEWLSQIERTIDTAAIAVLLVSADFLASDFIRREEIPRMLQRRSKEGLHLFPILVRSCDWQIVSWLASIQIRPRGARPLAAFHGDRRDAELTAIAKEIRGFLSPSALTADSSFASSSVAVPQLPTSHAQFVGREPDLKALRGVVSHSEVSGGKLTPRVNSKDPPPFWELGDQAFEEMCCDLLFKEPGISNCKSFGKRGQSQFGIDLKARRAGEDVIEVAQCKAQEKFAPAEIRAAGAAFLRHWSYWSTRKVRRFILIVACDLRSRQCHQAIEEQEGLFRQLGIFYEAWQGRTLLNKLSPHPDIVSRHFRENTEYWVHKICGREVLPYLPAATAAGILASALPGITMVDFAHLATQVSEGARAELEIVRSLARRGRSHEAQQRLNELMAGRSAWTLLKVEVQALALRLTTAFALEQRDLPNARLALQKLEALQVQDGIEVLRAAIVHIEQGPEKAIQVLATPTGPETRRFKAALLIEVGEFASALEILDSSATKDAEIQRLRGMALLHLGEAEEAFSAANDALTLQPEWLSVRIAFAVAGYFSSLSAVALPGNSVAWPQPVSWSLVRRDDESAERRRLVAEEARKALEVMELEDIDTRRLLETLRLACLACDPGRRQESESFCQELVLHDRLHAPAIAWALGRGFQLNFARSRKALEKRFHNKRADLNQIIALVACCLGDDRREQAARILQLARPVFEREGQLGLWLVQKAQVSGGKHASGQDDIPSQDLEVAEIRSVDLLVDVLDAQGQQDMQKLGRLAREALVEGHLVAFLEASETLARRAQWHLVAPFARGLVEKIGTADAARIAALATFSQGLYEECLQILSQAESMFPGKKLSADLRRLRVQTLNKLGRSPEAIELAEQIAREEETPEPLIDLVDLYYEKGDFTGVAFHARALARRSDLASEEVLRTAARIVSADKDVARDLFEKALQVGVPNEFLVASILLAHRLGAQEEKQNLVDRLPGVAGTDDRAQIRALTLEEFQEFQRQAAEEAAKLEEAYAHGLLPIHSFIVRPNISPSWLLGPLQRSKQGERARMQRPPLLLRHGGRGVPSQSELPENPEEWHIHLDTTAMLVADALEILPAVEQLFAPIGVPRNLPLALTHLEEVEEFQHQSGEATSGDQEAAALHEANYQERLARIRRLRAHLSHGIDRGVYRFIPESAGFRAYIKSLEEIPPPLYLAFVELLELEFSANNYIWVDDRLATAFLRSPGGNIVCITDLLAALEAYGGITTEQHHEKLQLLRSAGVRYLPLSADELFASLRSATVDEGSVIETIELKSLRRYFASCLESAELIQRPPVPKGFPNPHGELWFFVSFQRAIQDTLLRVFADEESNQEQRWARASWVWDSLWVSDLPSLFHPHRNDAERLGWLSLHLVDLIIRSVLLASEPSEAADRERDCLAWLEAYVLRTSLRANRGLGDVVAQTLKRLFLDPPDEGVAEKFPAAAWPAFKCYLIDRIPEPIRSLLLNDKEMLAGLEGIIEQTAGFDGIVFSARKLWTAMEAASRGELTQASTCKGSRHFIVSWKARPSGPSEVYLEEVPQGIRVRVADPIVELVSPDVETRRTLLTQHPIWFDRSDPERSDRIARIALESETWRRVEMVLEARASSSAVYYGELAEVVAKSPIKTMELLPPSLDSLLRYHRLAPALSLTDFTPALEQSARTLLHDEGLEEAIRRLAGLPVPLPTCLLEALTALGPESREAIIRGSVGSSGSTMSTFHLVRIRLHLLGKAPVSSEQFTPLVQLLWDDTQLRWATAFVALLRWVHRQLRLWEGMLQLPAALRLALVWSHAHQLARAFSGVGAQPESLQEAFSGSEEEDMLGPDILCPDLSYPDDVADPAGIEPQFLFLQGTLYALGNHLPEGLAASGKEWWLRLTTQEVDEGRALRIPFLQTHRFAGNLLGSFLCSERWQSLVASMASETWCPPPEEFLHDKILEALRQLGQDQSQPDQWILLSAILGSLAPPPDTLDDLADRISKFDFVDLYRQVPKEAFGLLHWATRLASRMDRPQVAEGIRTQILAAATILRDDAARTHSPSPEEKWANYLLDLVRWISIAKGDALRSSEQFATLAGCLVDAWPEILSLTRGAMERLSRTVALDQAAHLRPLILRLRRKD
jgi:tetratricopeptide (TPR) repeat protein